MKIKFKALILLSVAICLLTSIGSQARLEVQKDQPSKKSASVADVIATTRLADPDYFRSGSSKGRVPLFSPDGKLFLILLRKGNLEKNTNEFSLLLYRTDEALRSPKPQVLLKMSSSSNRDAISRIRWLSDNATILFLGENPGEVAQVYKFNVNDRRLIKRTNSVSAVTNYDCDTGGMTLLFTAEQSPPTLLEDERERFQREGVLIRDQSLGDLQAGRYGEPKLGPDLFWQRQGRSAVRLRIPPDNYFLDYDVLHLAPDGRHAVVQANLNVRALLPEWREYDYGQNINSYIRGFFTLPMRKTPTPFSHLLLVDLDISSSITPLWSAPSPWGVQSVIWGRDSKSIFLSGVRLPLQGVSAEERALRQRNTYDVAISLPTKEYRNISKEELPKAEPAPKPLDVILQEDPNTPPKIFVIDPGSTRKISLLDPNPQFSQLKLGKVQTIEWTVEGITLIGGLYLPPDYIPGRRYPLVIQTHGFASTRFSMDGAIEWSSGFAARPLAANDCLVLQLQDFKSRYDHDHFQDTDQFGRSTGEKGRMINVRGIEGAIDYLDGKGMIDKQRVGIVGFSRSNSWVAYLLTHSSKHFAAASLVDGTYGGYLQELLLPEFAWDKDDMNGGVSPFGDGLKTWLRESPSFSLDKVNAPVRLLALGGSGGVSDLWEWFAALSLQNKPVEYILLPDAPHQVVKPSERVVAQQGLVDWFRFWLKDEEDSDPAKAEQYKRWRELRKLQEENEKKRQSEIGPIKK